MRLVIFDADGTMINSQAIILEGMRLAFTEFGYTPPDTLAALSTIGLTLNLVFATLLERPVDDEIERMSESYKKRSFELQKLPHLHSPLYHGITQVVDILSRQPETLLAIATGKSRRGLNSMIDAHGLRDKLMVWRTADDCPSKPHPAMVLECCEVAGCSPSQTVMIGDSSYDMKMAVQAGAKALGVSWGYQSVSSLENSGAHAIVQHPDDLPAAIDAIFRSSDL
jgi:phosphoglycolate phosphatase